MILFLLVALPAIQTPARADAPGLSVITMRHGGKMQQRRDRAPAAPSHHCLCSIAPLDLASYAPALAMLGMIKLPLRPPTAPSLLASARPPEPPPPRFSV